MRCRILHEASGRMRVHVLRSRMTPAQADILEYYLRDLPFVREVTVYERTGDAVIRYGRNAKTREQLITALSSFSYEDERALSLVPEQTGRMLNRQYEEKIVLMVVRRGLRWLLLPAPVRSALVVLQSGRFLLEGLRCLRRGKLEVPVLDAAAIGASILRGDLSTASSVMFLLTLGETLEEWTHRKSVEDLARSMALQVERVWVRRDGTEVLEDVRRVQTGECILVRTAGVIPLDGRVLDGEATVNQASMTGESVPVVRREGGYVYAGTVIEEGSLLIEVARTAGSGKYDQIVRMIEETEKLKSGTETRAFHLADRLVPWSLAGAAVTWLLTRNTLRAVAWLMVDFSCALKLSMPLAVLSAIREAGQYGITVKGGKFLEAVAEADTLVFDKTGTLTHATPKVVRIDCFGGRDETEVLRLAACLEEHYPHSVANAVVEEARMRGITHEEKHSSVQYVVAHGISSAVDGDKVIIGSYHFVFEDEGCRIPEGEEDRLAQIPAEYSQLYLAIGGELAAVISIFDPIREEAPEVVQALHELGIRNVCMMTGDNRRTAEAIAQRLPIDEFHAEVLPEDKAAYIRAKKEQGGKVLMVGDGVNDTPALSEADCGIAVSDGAAIAREVADITISADSLYQILLLRRLSMQLMERIRSNYRFIISFNAGLIALGAAGVLAPSLSALLHNTSTVAAGIHSMTDLPERPENARCLPDLTV